MDRTLILIPFSDRKSVRSSSSSSCILAEYILNLIERLKFQSIRCSMVETYLNILQTFNKFLLCLDHKPKLWEERVTMFCTYLIEKGHKSATVKSYVSGIKKFLKEDNFPWDDVKLILTSLMQACKLHNDVVCCRRPITKGLLELLLFEVDRVLNSTFLCTMYKAMICLRYYGMMREGELTESPHTAKACNVHIGRNKDKILILL